MSNYVIYDCDFGSDDAWGLFMLLKAEAAFANSKSTTIKNGPGKFKTLAITCVQGNTDVENVAKNAIIILDCLNRTDIPVYKGCDQPLLPRLWKRTSYFHGKNGFGDIKYEKNVDFDLIKKEHAVNAMYEYVNQYPNMIDFILVGPLTNFAMCINMYGAKFLNKVRNVYVMGGNFRGKGNISKSAEFNFLMDPEAAHVVFETIKKPMIVLPWETCIDGDFGISLDWRFKVIGAIKHPAIELLNRVEEAVLVSKNFVNWIICDAILVAAYLFPNAAIEKSRNYHVAVELTGTHTRGQMVLDHLRLGKENACIITEIHREHYKNIISWTAGLEGNTIDQYL